MFEWKASYTEKKKKFCQPRRVVWCQTAGRFLSQDLFARFENKRDSSSSAVSSASPGTVEIEHCVTERRSVCFYTEGNFFQD